MALGEYFKIETKGKNLFLNIYKGHYATSHSHMNYYIDIAQNKSCLSQAKAVANVLANNYRASVTVDTILCLDNTEVIGTCLANELSGADFYNINAGKEINILTPEHVSGSQIYFRDNTAPMIKNKDVIIMAASVVTGFTVESAIEAVRYFGGNPVGICSIFSAEKECMEFPVVSVFNINDLPGYETNLSIDCPMCKRGEKINALVNSFGCSLL